MLSQAKGCSLAPISNPSRPRALTSRVNASFSWARASRSDEPPRGSQSGPAAPRTPHFPPCRDLFRTGFQERCMNILKSFLLCLLLLGVAYPQLLVGRLSAPPTDSHSGRIPSATG